MISKILFQGNYSKNNVTCKYIEVSSRKIDPIIEIKVKKLWQQKVEEAKKNGKKVWDQSVYRLEKFHVNRNMCELEFSTIPFSIRSSVKDFTNDLMKKGEEYLPMAVYSSVFIETVEGNFVFGEKSDEYVANRKYSYIGGVFNRFEEHDGDVDLFNALSNEVKEELGIEESDIEEFKLLGAFRGESCNVGFVFYCRLKLTKEDVVDKFKDGSDLELNNIFFARRKDLRDVGINKIGKEPELVDIFEQSINA